MAKYKVGDKVRIVSKNPNAIGFTDEMEKYLGKTLTVLKVHERPYGLSTYNFKEATAGNPSMDLPRKVFYWNFAESWISGPADGAPEEPLSVHIRFCGNLTVAELIKDGKAVKVENARCNPKDTYSRAEGARVAVERLFKKKEKPPKPGSRYVITGNLYGCYHSFNIGDTVYFLKRVDGQKDCSKYVDKSGLVQIVRDCDVRPYKETAK